MIVVKINVWLLVEKKQQLIDKLWLCMLEDKRFILPQLVRYNCRYKEEFNYFASHVSFELLVKDYKHIFFKLMYSKTFKKSWDYFELNYDELKPFLIDNLYARQMLILFVTHFIKINKLWKNKKYKWIIEATPYVYLNKIKVTKYFNKRQQMG